MKLPNYLWIKDKKYYLYDVYSDSDFLDLKKYCERQRKRNGTRWYIRSFDIFTIFPETKHALYLNKTISLEKKNLEYKKDKRDTRWNKTKWG